MSGAMRVLQVLDKAPHDGGVAVHVAALSDRLRARGHEVQTLRLHDPQLPPPPAAPGDSLRLPWTYGPWTSQRHGGELQRQLREFAPTLVHVHGAFSAFSAASLRRAQSVAPLLGTLHDTRAFCFHMSRRFGPTGEPCGRRCGSGCIRSGCVRPQDTVDALRLARRWWVDRVNLRQWCALDRVVVPSRYLGDLAVQHGLPPERLRVVPHGTPWPAPAALPVAPLQPPGVLFVGALVDYKGVHALVQALALLRDRPWQGVIVGEGPLAPALRGWLAEAGLADRVRLVGRLTARHQIDDWMRRARLLVLPSTVPESFGLVGIEALAVGTPVVSFGLGGVMEWLRDGENGLLARPCDPSDLARQTARLLDDEALARRLGAAGRTLVEARFEDTRAFDALLAVYDELLQARA